MKQFSHTFPLRLFFFLLFFFSAVSLQAQDTTRCKWLTPSAQFNPHRVRFLAVTAASVYAGTMIGLNTAWYSQYPRSSFHFFNDNTEWNQLDKIGHVYTSYAVGRLSMDILRWSGVKDKQSIRYGGSIGFAYLTIIEILDGFSKQWGFSLGDMAANTAGGLLVIGQELGWHEQKITLKFSSHKVDYSDFDVAHIERAKKLYGNNFAELTLKDYNGQTYWLSFNVASFLPKENKFPKWLNFDVGYGSEQIFSGEEVTSVGTLYEFPKRYRQYYFSLDADLTKIKTKSRFLKTFFELVNVVKFPAPAIEYSKAKGWKAYPFYF